MRNNDSRLTPNAEWEIAFVYAFATVFRDSVHTGSLHSFPAFSPGDLESSLQQFESGLVDQLLCAFAANALNRKKPLEKETYTKALSALIDTKHRVLEFDLDHNPLSKTGSFHSLPVTDKLVILRSLVEWQLQDSNAVRSIIDQQKVAKDGDATFLLSLPLGFDSQKRAYWQFGDEPWLWREKANISTGCRWETVCRDLDELKQLPNTLSAKNRAERNLSRRIVEELIPKVEDQQRQQERKDRAKARQIAMEEIAHAPRELRPRDRRKPVRYAEFDPSFYEYDSSEMAPVPLTERPKPSRTSSRLNPNLAHELEDQIHVAEDFVFD